MTDITPAARRWVQVYLCLILLFGSMSTARCQSPPPPPNNAAVKADLQRILNEPEFRPESTEPGVLTKMVAYLRKEWDIFVNWIRHKLGMDRNSSPVRESYPADNVLLRILLPVLMAVLVVITVLLIVRAIKGRGPRPKKAVTTAHFDIDSAQADMVTEPDVWLAQARTFAQSGDFRRALRAVFLGAILELDRAGALRIERGQTNGEYLRILRLQQLTAYYRALDPMVGDFDVRWYGSGATTEADYSTAVSRYEALKGLTREAAAARGAKPARSAK